MSNGVQITKNSLSVKGAGTDDFYVNSDTPLFKLFKSGSGTRKFVGTAFETYNIVIPHGLGYVPFFLVYMDRNPGANRRLVATSETELTALPTDISCFISDANSSNIVITANTFGAGTTTGVFGYNYFIYYDGIDDD